MSTPGLTRTSGIVSARMRVAVDHSWPSGWRSACSCWLALVYGYGRSLTRYWAQCQLAASTSTQRSRATQHAQSCTRKRERTFAAAFCRRSDRMTWSSLASLRCEASTPGIFLMNRRRGATFLDLRTPLPDQVPQPGRVSSTSLGASCSISRCFSASNCCDGQSRGRREPTHRDDVVVGEGASDEVTLESDAVLAPAQLYRLVDRDAVFVERVVVVRVGDVGV